MALTLLSGSGTQLITYQEIPDLKTWKFNDAAVSATTGDEYWLLYSDANYQGNCLRIAPNLNAVKLGALGSSPCCSSARPLPSGSPVIVIFRDSNYRGPCLIVKGPMPDLTTQNFNNSTTSAFVIGGTWALYDGANYTGASKTLQPGWYQDAAAVGLANHTLSSLRPV
jgi:hypothetical protein